MVRKGNRGSSEFSAASTLTLLACVVALMLGPSQLIFSNFTLFAGPISAEFHWGHAQLSSLLTVLGIAMALGGPTKGYIFDRWGVRPVLLALTPILGILIALVAVATARNGLMLIVFGIIGLLTPGNMPFGKIIGEWFQRKRGIAFSVMAMGLTLAFPVSLQGGRWLIDGFGWRRAFLVYGALNLLLVLPLLTLFLRRPVRRGERSITDVALEGRSMSEALRSREYWLVIASVVLVVLVYTVITTNGIGILGEKGFSRSAATSALSLMPIGTLISQPLLGYLLDRFDTPRVALVFALMAPVGLWLIQISNDTLALDVGFILLGTGTGGEAGTTQYFLSRYFGLRKFSLIYGSVQPFTCAVSIGVGQLLAGLLIDRTGGYHVLLWTMEGTLILAAFLTTILPAYVYAPHGQRVARREEGTSA